jgi:hypothetical protein
MDLADPARADNPEPHGRFPSPSDWNLILKKEYTFYLDL